MTSQTHDNMCLEHGTPPAILVGAEGRAENQARQWRAHGADAHWHHTGLRASEVSEPVRRRRPSR
eukprot:scaffold100333_cov96-Phaeocystis_antarctica.AAC.1